MPNFTAKTETRFRAAAPTDGCTRAVVLLLCLLLMFPPEIYAAFQAPLNPTGIPETTEEAADLKVAIPVRENIPELSEDEENADEDEPTVVTADGYKFDEEGRIPFNPNPERAVWLSALCPGLGQIYNRRYWKLPIVVGGFMGLGYATGWNNTQFQDYSRAYRDLTDNDPLTNSYMDFFPPNTLESSLDKNWLQQVMKSRKDNYRRNRDLCIICLVALYLLCMVDAYVDASLAHFDVSPDLSMDLGPSIFMDNDIRRPALGLQWAFNF